MRDLLLSDTVPAYLDTPGKALLTSARSVARSVGVAGFDLVPVLNGTYWFPWAGSAALRTLMILGSCWGGFDVLERGIALFYQRASPDRVMNFYTDILSTCPSKNEIAQKYGDLVREKYDSYVPETLLVKGFAERYIETQVVPPRTVAPFEQEEKHC